MTNTQKIERAELAIKEIYEALEAIFDRVWPADSKVIEIVNEINQDDG